MGNAHGTSAVIFSRNPERVKECSTISGTDYSTIDSGGVAKRSPPAIGLHAFSVPNTDLIHAAFRKRQRLAGKGIDQGIQVAKPLILSLFFYKTKVDLLNDYSDLEPRKDFVKNNL